MLVQREVFCENGGFDSEFDPAYFEDVDLCLRLRARGLYTYCAANLTVVHQESATSSEIWHTEDINAIIENNHRKFLRRWSSYLESRFHNISQMADDGASGEPVAPAETVLLECHGSLDDSVSGAVTLKCAAALQAHFDVTIASDDVYGHSGFTALCEKFGINMRNVRLVALDEKDRLSYKFVVPVSSDAMDYLISPESIKGMKTLFDRINGHGKVAPVFN